MSGKLNPRQMKFVEGIDSGQSLVGAYREAGYTKNKTAYAGASQLLRNPKVLAELDDRLFCRNRTAQQRFGPMQDGATNIYIKILKMEATADNVQLLALQQKVASDVFDRSGHKPKEQVEYSGGFKINVHGVNMDEFPEPYVVMKDQEDDTE